MELENLSGLGNIIPYKKKLHLYYDPNVSTNFCGNYDNKFILNGRRRRCTITNKPCPFNGNKTACQKDITARSIYIEQSKAKKVDIDYTEEKYNY